MLNLANIKSDSVSVSFSSNNELILTYEGESGQSSEYFQGKFRKRGYYEIYLRKKNIQIPPLFPIIYSSTDILRIRISLTKEKDLIIDIYKNRGGNIFLMAGGGRSRYQLYFKPNK